MKPPLSSRRQGVRLDPGVVRVLAAQERCPGGAAQGICDEGLVEGRALIDEQGLELRHDGGRPYVKIVGEDEDEVGTFCGLDATLPDLDWRHTDAAHDDERRQQEGP